MTTTRKLLLGLSGLIALALLLFLAYAWLSLHWAYSEGERAGYLQKFSKKGWLCKTWEGEILLSSMPGAIPEKFAFTVRDEATAEQLSAAAGRRVLLSYAQRKGVPSSCFGDSEYFVDKVQIQP